MLVLDVIGWVIGGAVIAALTGLFLYWQLVVAEGAYFGRRVVALLYDWFAPRYDKVKQFQPAMDAVMLAAPIMRHLSRMAADVKDGSNLHGQSTRSVGNRRWEILDVATGTGRLPLTLMAQPGFHGHIVALDLSPRMLAQAQAKLAGHAERITWMQHDAQQLPFEDDHFDAVVCLEALEFFPRPRDAIREMARVLKPGGLMMISNRTGPDVWKLPGRAVTSAAFVTRLEQAGLRDIQVEQWLIDYDLVRAIK